MIVPPLASAREGVNTLDIRYYMYPKAKVDRSLTSSKDKASAVWNTVKAWMVKMCLTAERSNKSDEPIDKGLLLHSKTGHFWPWSAR